MKESSEGMGWKDDNKEPEGPAEGRGTEMQINTGEGGKRVRESSRRGWREKERGSRRWTESDSTGRRGRRGRSNSAERKGRVTKAAMRRMERKNLYINYGCGSKDNGAL